MRHDSLLLILANPLPKSIAAAMQAGQAALSWHPCRMGTHGLLTMLQLLPSYCSARQRHPRVTGCGTSMSLRASKTPHRQQGTKQHALTESLAIPRTLPGN